MSTTLESLDLKAVTTAASDKGLFECVVSSAAVDREGDITSTQGMLAALRRWSDAGRKVPLVWHHGTRAEDSIGHIDPSTARIVGDEVIVGGFIDRSTPIGAHAFRLAKARTLSFSFGYLIPQGGATPRPGGGRNLNELDLFEITATSTPVQPACRVLSTKAVTPRQPLSAEELAAMARRVGVFDYMPRRERAVLVQQARADMLHALDCD